MPRRHIIPAAIAALLALLAPAVAQQSPAPQPAAQTPGPPPITVIPTTRQVASISVQDLVRLGGQGDFPLRGIGIVVGLKGTGDSGAELALAQPLAALYERSGNPIPDLKYLSKAKSAAIVWIDCTVPEQGAREDDRFNVRVSAMHSATSLKGGRLIISPLTEIRLDNPQVYAFASGPIRLEDDSSTTTGVIYDGAQMARPVKKNIGKASIELVVRPVWRSFSTTRVLAAEVNGLRANLEEADTPAEQIALALDDQTVRVTIPEEERADPTNFIASILTKSFSPDLLDLPAMVVINRDRKNIVFTGDVEISATTAGANGLEFITINTPTQSAPAVSTAVTVAPFGTTARQSERARIQDLLAAFRALSVPFDDQVDLIQSIYATGRLNAKLVFE